ncbi:hypothetical protein MesoLj131a_66010 (plasmid) [Mesorhizobium sp. 131-2-1]|nr:hypothetical protein MesoLj131a_66010 [Mesorhizobium sp. 131-2-1]
MAGIVIALSPFAQRGMMPHNGFGRPVQEKMCRTQMFCILCLEFPQQYHKTQQKARLSSSAPFTSYQRPCEMITRSGFQAIIR